ncbi:hypothetical protein ACA910_008227 [Epithemia clementina (nom. ined.)]
MGRQFTSSAFLFALVAVIYLLFFDRNEWRKAGLKQTDFSDHAVHHRKRRRLDGMESSRYDYASALRRHLEMFSRSSAVEVIGPSSFPKPSDKAKKASNDEVIVTLKPALGQHRPEKDAVLVLAAEFRLDIYVQFIESLIGTGFDGDIVLSVHENDLQKADIREYLSYYANGRGVVVYTPHQVCFTSEKGQVDSANGGSRKCKLHGLFGKKLADGSVEQLDDPRHPRTVQNIRYETYWVMASAYDPSSWILLVDARDTVFQANPFEHLPRKTDPTEKSGLLYFFGENMDASLIGHSVRFNYRWINAAYGLEVAQSLKAKPIICSGTTMGEKVAVETYLRAMVAEADETGTVIMGSDQGFHNRLYYSNKLQNADQIHAIVVFDQGSGIVNNLAALRSKKLEEWGNGKLVEIDNYGKYEVKNWDGSISPVVHQFDRHKELSMYFTKVKQKKDFSKWKARAKLST